MNLWAHAINDTQQLVKVHKIQSHFVCQSYWNISINFKHTAFGESLQFVSVKPSVTFAEASCTVFRFLVLEPSNKMKETLKGPTKHLEAKTLRVNTQDSISHRLKWL